MVEIMSALNRLVREESLTLTEYQHIRDVFQQDCHTTYQMLRFTNTIVTLTGKLLERHPLRAYDAVHLATALIVHRLLQAGDESGLVFLCADNRLNAAAAAEGLAVDNPNDHP